MEDSVCLDHIHLCVQIPPKISVSKMNQLINDLLAAQNQSEAAAARA